MKWFPCVVVIAVLAVACGGDDADDASRIRPVDTAFTSILSTTRQPASTTSRGPTTTKADATTTTVGAPATTRRASAPTNPPATGYVDEGASSELEAELIGIVGEVREIHAEALRTLELPEQRLARVAGTRFIEAYRREVDHGRAAGHVHVPPEGSITKSEFDLVLRDGDLAVVDECQVNDIVVMVEATGEVVDDRVGVRRLQWTLQRYDGVWRATDAQVLDEQIGATSCND